MLPLPARSTLAVAFRALPGDVAAIARSRQLQLAFAAVTAIFVFAGPFGTRTLLDPPLRAAYWIGVMALSWGLVLAHLALLRRMAPRLGLSDFASGLLGALAAAPLTTTAILLAGWPVFGTPPDLDAWLAQAGPNAAINVSVAALALLADGARPSILPPPPEAAGPPGPPPLLGRLPPGKRGRLLRLEMQDHYVRVVTDAGTHLLLMRMADAVAECAPERGARVHRSHWVARAAVTGLERRPGGRQLRTRDGAAIPVARSRTADLRAEGWRL